MLGRAMIDGQRFAQDADTKRKPLTIPIHVQAQPKSSILMLLLHLGRLTTYAIIGAVFGVAGTFVLKLNFVGVHQILYLLGNALLLLLGFRLLGVLVRLPSPTLHLVQNMYQRLQPGLHRSARHPFLTGLAWGLLPCGLSFAIAPFAILSGAAWSGAILMLCFGLAALPHLLLTQALSRHWSDSRFFVYVRWACGVTMIAVAGLGLFYWDMQSMPDFLCVSPKSV